MKQVTCCSTLEAGLPICSMVLRPLPALVGTGGHLRILDKREWLDTPGVPERCRCSTPHLEHVLSPLGVPIEVLYGSPEHHVCIDANTSSQVLRMARVELQAEALFVHRPLHWVDDFDHVVLTHKAALQHILSLSNTHRSQDALERAQYHVRIAVAREEALRAIGWCLGRRPSASR